MNTLSIISMILGIVLSAISIIALIKTGLLNMKAIKEGLKQILRSQILEIYYKHEVDKTLRQYERENLDCLVKAYKALGGNNFIDDIYDEMRDWKVVS